MAVMTSFLSLLEPLTETKFSLPPQPRESPEEISPSQAAEEMAAQARQALTEAEETRTRAQAEADEMRGDARLQSEALREAAWQEGFHNGKETAHSQVEAELRAQWETEHADFRAEAQRLIEGIIQARQALWETQEAEMIGFVLDIARQVIKTEVAQNQEIVGGIVRSALRRVVDKENVRIRVSLGDAPHLRETREDILSLVDGIKNLEIVEDRRVGDGGCLIETNAGTIDAKIETQLAEVERALTHAIEG